MQGLILAHPSRLHVPRPPVDQDEGIRQLRLLGQRVVDFWAQHSTAAVRPLLGDEQSPPARSTQRLDVVLRPRSLDFRQMGPAANR